MSNWNGAGSSWQYSRWMRNAARNARITEPIGAEALLYRIAVAYFCDPINNTGTRPWLKDAYYRKATAAAGGADYQCDIGTEPMSVIIELTDVVGRDLKKLPITDAEKATLDILGWIQENGLNINRRFGVGTRFGGTSGSVVGV